MRWHLGIDGGGTQTRSILVDNKGRVRGSGVAGPSNYHNVGATVSTLNILKAAAHAWEQAGKPFSQAASAFVGLAGIKSAQDISTMTSGVEGCHLAAPGTIIVANDLHNALAGGLEGRPGIALIAGTGCNCLGIDSRGKTAMCGGWGWLIGDRGAGFGLAAEGLRTAARAADGCPPRTRLLDAALAFFGISEPNELLARLYVGEWRPGIVAEFAPVVIRLAAEGDVGARRVLKGGADDLARIVAATASHLDYPSGADLALLGGCLTSGAPYQPMVEAAIRKVCPEINIRPAAHGTLYGAGLNALRCGGIALESPLIQPARSPIL